MSEDRRIEIRRHLSEEELDRLLDEVDDPNVTKSVNLIVKEAAE